MYGTGTGSGASASIESAPEAARSFSASISFSMDSRMAILAARWQISVRSAPEKPWSVRARKVMSTRFVAPMMKTDFFEPMPSISVRIWLMTRSPARDRVELVEEEDARRGAARLLEELAHVRLGLAEPHREELGPLDRDEVGLALVGDGLGEERLAAARRAVEEHALRRRHPELLELVGELDGVLHRLLQLALDALEAANVVPRHVGHLDGGLAQRRRVGHAERLAEVRLRDGHRVEHLGVDLVVVQVDDIHLLTDALHRRLRAQ